MNKDWTNFITTQLRTSAERPGPPTQSSAKSASAVLKEIGLDSTDDVSKFVDKVATKFFRGRTSLTDRVCLAQIAAKLNASVSDGFLYNTRDMRLRSGDVILFDDDGGLEDLLPDDQRESQLLNKDYTRFASCSQEEWNRWIESGHARIQTFIPLKKTITPFSSRPEIEEEVRRRGLLENLPNRYKHENFVLVDWDFEKVYWEHWERLAAGNKGLWVEIAERLLAQPETYWHKARSAIPFQVGTTGKMKQLTDSPLLPAWVVRLRDLPCLPDDHGIRWKPVDLLLRTPETEPVKGSEPFVDARLDRERTRLLLDLLGVQSTPAGPDGLLNRLRDLMGSERPPVHEVEKWYRSLDQMVHTCSTDDLKRIIQVLKSEAIILTQDDSWVTALDVFLYSDEDNMPGAPVIRSSVRDLTLWQKAGVANRPSADHAFKWLKSRPTGMPLSGNNVRRVRALQGKYPLRIWDECRTLAQSGR